MKEKFIYAVIENPARPASPTPARWSGGSVWRAGGNGASIPFVLDGLKGLDGAALEIVCYRDLAAVVSSISAKRFNPALGEQDFYGKREEGFKADMVKYQQVNASLFNRSGPCAMIPLRFGFAAKSRHEIEEVLRRVYLQLKTLLARLKGKAELVVQAFWDLPKVLLEVRDEQSMIGNPELVVEVGRQLFEAAEVRRRKFVEAIHENLSPLAKDFSEGPRKSEAMILNRSYLVDREREPLFDKAMDFLATKFEGHLTFGYIGPLPAYSFANIELRQGNFALVESARKTLQLPEKASWDQMKASYRSLVRAYHPDRNPDSSQTEERCKEVVMAYEVLTAYCNSLEKFGGERVDDRFSFTREDVEKVFVVKNERALHPTP